LDDNGKTAYKGIDFKSVNYIEFIPILIAGVKELDEVNKDLQVQIDELKKQMEQLNAENNLKVTYLGSMELNTETGILYQNEPNPFDNTTVIRFYVPEGTSNAKIIYMDVSGKYIDATEVSESGMGLINVEGAKLGKGVYTYSLEIDGKICDTKRMIRN
jgi:hypothetical protein